MLSVALQVRATWGCRGFSRVSLLHARSKVSKSVTVYRVELETLESERYSVNV